MSFMYNYVRSLLHEIHPFIPFVLDTMIDPPREHLQEPLHYCGVDTIFPVEFPNLSINGLHMFTVPNFSMIFRYSHYFLVNPHFLQVSMIFPIFFGRSSRSSLFDILKQVNVLANSHCLSFHTPSPAKHQLR